MKNRSHFCRVFFVIALLCLSFNSAPASAQIKNADEAVNIAGKQRTLTQQMLKNYSLISLKVRIRKSEQELAQEVSLFDTQLADLTQFAKDPAAQQQISKVNQAWQELKVIYTQEAKPSALSKLNISTGNLLNASEQLVTALLKGSNNPKISLLNFANSEQMLIQKIVVLYALKTAGDEVPYQQGYNKAVTDFQLQLDTLNNYPQNGIKTRSQLGRVGKHFKRFATTVAAGKSGNYLLAIVSTAADKLVLQLTEVVPAYQ